jgi:hypothetical protein
VIFAVRWISHSSARLWTICCLRVLAKLCGGPHQVSSHARIHVLTVSGLSSAKIRALGELYDNHEIIALLSGQGVKNSTGKPFTVGMIRAIRYKHRILGPSLPVGTLNVSQVRERYGVSLSVVYYWIERGIVSAVQRKSYR